MRFVTKALVLNRYELGESDLLLTILSPVCGRFSAIAKGARRSKRRFVNVLEPFTLLRAYLRKRRSGLSPFLDQADLLRAWEAIRLDPWRFTLASYLTELAELFSRPNVGQEIFYLLKEALEAIAKEGPSNSLKLAFELKLLSLTGFGPDLSQDGLLLSSKEIAILRTFLRYPLSNLRRIRVAEAVFLKAANAIEDFLLRVLDQEINALRVWKEMNSRGQYK